MEGKFSSVCRVNFTIVCRVNFTIVCRVNFTIVWRVNFTIVWRVNFAGVFGKLCAYFLVSCARVFWGVCFLGVCLGVDSTKKGAKETPNQENLLDLIGVSQQIKKTT